MGGMDSIFDEEELPPPDVPSCVIEGTLIQTLRGTIPVEWVEIGDFVYSYDFEKSDFGFFKVLGLNIPVEKREWATIITSLGHKLSCTLDHPVFSDSIESGELPIQDAEIGSPVYVLEKGKLIKDSIESIVTNTSRIMVYNFEVDQVHTYISNNILSHNVSTKGTPDTPGATPGTSAPLVKATEESEAALSSILSGVIFTTTVESAFGHSGASGEILDPGDPDATTEGSIPSIDSEYWISLDPELPFAGQELVDIFNSPTISNIDVSMVSEDGNYQITLECTVYVDEPRAYGHGVSHLAGQLLKSYGGGEISYFTSTTPSAAEAVMGTTSGYTAPGVSTIVTMEETDVSTAAVCENYWSISDLPLYNSYTDYYDDPLEIAYPEISWDQADPTVMESTYVHPVKLSTDFTRDSWPSVLAFRNIDPALINELSSPITSWREMKEGIVDSMFAPRVHIDASTYMSSPTQGEVLNLLYQAQEEMTTVDTLAGIPFTWKEEGRQRYTPMKFYFTALISEQQLIDVTTTQNIHIRCWMLNCGSNEYKTGDWVKTSTHATMPIDIMSAIKGYIAGKTEPVTIQIDAASEHSSRDLIELLNPNPFYIHYTVNESYFDEDMHSFVNISQTGKLDPYGLLNVTSLNNYNLGDVRFYRVVSSTDLFNDVKKVNVAGFGELFTTEYISSVTINMDKTGKAIICNIPMSCTDIDYYVYRKGNLSWRVSGTTATDAAKFQGRITGDRELQNEGASSFKHDSIDQKWEGSIFTPSTDGASYLVQFIFKNRDGSTLGWFDACCASNKLITENLGIETITFGVQEGTRTDETVNLRIYETKSGNISTEALDVIRESTELSMWQSEVDAIKNNTGTVTQYTVFKIDDTTGTSTQIPGTFHAGDTVSCPLNGISTSGKLRFEFRLSAASLAEGSKNTAIKTETNPSTRAGNIFEYQYLAQEKNWPLIFPGDASPGETYGLSEYFNMLVPSKTVSKTITVGRTEIDPYISSIAVERSLIGQCNIITVSSGGSQDLVNHYLLYAEYGGVSAPIQIMVPNTGGELVFIDSQNFNFYGTVIYSMKIINSSMLLLENNDWPTVSISRNNSIDLINSTDGHWGSRSLLY